MPFTVCSACIVWVLCHRGLNNNSLWLKICSIYDHIFKSIIISIIIRILRAERERGRERRQIYLSFFF